jgi:diketogulonate reductase-like aldo/keto reductase
MLSRRRRLLKSLGLLPVALCSPSLAAGPKVDTRRILSTGEPIPAIGMGSWLTFDVGADPVARSVRLEVLREFLASGGRLIDSSPMYGSSESVIGYCLHSLDQSNNAFSATKVWTLGEQAGIDQMQRSAELWRAPRFDLIQVHNLLDWKVHLKTLYAWKAEGKVRYIGVTTSHGRRHNRMEQLMRRFPLDFIQLTYNIADREAENRLLPLAADRGISAIVNRPFRRGALFSRVAGKPLPVWAGEFGCENWAQFFLKFVVSHPAVTCAIPATRRVDHMRENMGALAGGVPGPRMRRKMADHFANL